MTEQVTLDLSVAKEAHSYSATIGLIKQLVRGTNYSTRIVEGDNVHYLTLVDKMTAEQRKSTVLTPIMRDISDYAEMSQRSIKERIERHERAIRNAKEELINAGKRLSSAQQMLNAIAIPEEETANKVLDELLKIRAHNKVREVIYTQSKLTILTNHLDIYNEDKVYDGAEYLIVIDITNGDVRFNSTNRRRSHWSSEDPHPHVSGNDGRACLGNIETSVAELCSQREYLVLAFLLIDFLESVNTADTAGRNIVNWDQINPNTRELIKQGHNNGPMRTLDCGCDVTQEDYENGDDHYTCEDCGEEHCDDHGSWVSNHGFVCRNCLDRNYTWSERVEEYIHEDDWDSEIHEY